MPRWLIALALAVASISLAETNSNPSSATGRAVTTWSRAAHPLPNALNADPTLRSARVPSPNGKYEIACSVTAQVQQVSDSEAEDIPSCELVGSGKRMPIDLKVGPEALWSPDSDAVAVTHSDGGALGTYHVLVYRPEDNAPVELASAVRKDLARRFPACVGGGCTAEERRRMRRSSDWVNVAAIRWMENSDRLLLMAWVPDSSGFGANLGKYNGYLVDAHTGRILNRYSQEEFQKRFRKYCGDWGL